MVEISKNDFNRDMESYISRVKDEVEKPKPDKKIADASLKKEKDAQSQEFKEEEKEFYSNNKSIFTKFLDFISGEEGDKAEMENEIKKEEIEDEKELEEYSEKTIKKNKGIFSSIKGLFSGNEEESLPSEKKEDKKEETDVPDDIKAVLKIQNQWILKLPVKTLKEFKESDDYKVYKETLQKHNLIKIK